MSREEEITTYDWPQCFVWLDIETSGLEPSRDRLLEVAMVLTGPDLEPVQTFRAVLGLQDLKMDEISPEVLSMHVASGLWRESMEEGLTLEQFTTEIKLWCTRILAPIQFADPPMLAGSSVHFDRTWAHSWFPVLLEHVSHRHLDISTFKAGLVAWGMGDHDEPAREERAPEWPPHRAMADIAYDLRRARWYKCHLYRAA